MQDFGDWLRAREEFEYIVDGANVAYNSQNFGKGMFSFKQVRLIQEFVHAVLFLSLILFARNGV